MFVKNLERFRLVAGKELKIKSMSDSEDTIIWKISITCSYPFYFEWGKEKYNSACVLGNLLFVFASFTVELIYRIILCAAD